MATLQALKLTEPPDLSTQTYHDLVHAYGCITTRSAEIYRDCGITEQQYHVLRILEAAPCEGLPCLEIARQLPTPAPDITRLLDRMRRAGTIMRQRLEADRRVVMIELTERGRRVLQRVKPRLSDFHRERLSHLSRNELNLLGRLLRKAGTRD